MWYHLFYINLIKFTITVDKLMVIYNYYGINDLLTEDACVLCDLCALCGEVFRLILADSGLPITTKITKSTKHEQRTEVQRVQTGQDLSYLRSGIADPVLINGRRLY